MPDLTWCGVDYGKDYQIYCAVLPTSCVTKLNTLARFSSMIAKDGSRKFSGPTQLIPFICAFRTINKAQCDIDILVQHVYLLQVRYRQGVAFCAALLRILFDHRAH